MLSLTQPDTLRRANGKLNLAFACDNSAAETRLLIGCQEAPLRVVRAFPTSDGAALVHLHNVSGGVLAGDRLETLVEVGPAAAAQLTTTGATRLYRSASPDEWAEQTFTANVAEAGLLEYLPDALIPFAGSRYRQRSRINLAEGAGLIWWEILSAGRVARGEYFQYTALDLDLEIWAGNQPLAIEHARLEPALRSLRQPSRLGPYNYAASFYLCRVGAPADSWLSLERDLSQMLLEMTNSGEVQWGASALAAHGLAIRGLSRTGRELLPGLFKLWSYLRPRVFGRSCPPPRKVY
jgi:urease accessory protein